MARALSGSSLAIGQEPIHLSWKDGSPTTCISPGTRPSRLNLNLEQASTRRTAGQFRHGISIVIRQPEAEDDMNMMRELEDKDLGGPFAVPDFQKPSAWLEFTVAAANEKNPLFSVDFSNRLSSLATAERQLPLSTLNVVDPPAPAKHYFFKLPSLLQDFIPHDTKTYTPPVASPSGESRSPTVEPPYVGDHDLWLGAIDSLTEPPRLKTWDDLEGDHRVPASVSFLTEVSPVTFDVLLCEQAGGNSPTTSIIDGASYLACLLALAMGRSSLLFSWDSEKRSFVKTTSLLRTSGVSLQSLNGVDKLCCECANATKQLAFFSEVVYLRSPTPTRVALAGAVDRLIRGVQAEVNHRGNAARSLLQLQSIIRPAHTVLTYFAKLVQTLLQETSDEAILSRLFQEAQSSEYQNDILEGATRELLMLVSRPWMDFVEEWVGLNAEAGAPITKNGPGRGFVKVADKTWIDDQGYELDEPDFFLDQDNLPSFVPEETARSAFEAGKNLRFLREHHPDNALSSQQILSNLKPPRLEWKFDWGSISQLEDRVKQYHEDLSRALGDAHREGVTGTEQPRPNVLEPQTFELQFFGKSDHQIIDNVLASMSRLAEPLVDRDAQDGLSALLRERLYPGSGSSTKSRQVDVHWSLAALMSFGPVISAQSTIINQECMRMLFSAHELRLHVDLLRQCFLLDNGLLCSRLSHALFDPDLETAERRAGVALGGGVMGLRLGGRETWPPASSELRLALMGVLSESYEPPAESNQWAMPPTASRSYNSDLPGDLSFSVRDLSPEEIDRCMDPDALEALDFLCLSYKAPPPLRQVITPTVLVKYDRIFMLLLRILRMLYIVNQLSHTTLLGTRRDQGPDNVTLRFCIEARHFIGQISTYFFGTGIITPWRHFESWLDAAEASSLDSHTLVPSVVRTLSPDILRERHEQVLDEILSTLLLRKRQAPVLKLLEETFEVILRFAKQLRGRDHGEARADSPEQLYKEFRKKIEVFLTVCKGLGEKAGSGGKGGGRGENSIEQLVMLVNMSGFYCRR